MEKACRIINIITKRQTPQGFAGNEIYLFGSKAVLRINRGVVGINAGERKIRI